MEIYSSCTQQKEISQVSGQLHESTIKISLGIIRNTYEEIIIIMLNSTTFSLKSESLLGKII